MYGVVRGAAVVIVGLGALVGYGFLNYAAKDEVGLGMAVSSAVIAGILNVIFHSLPVQRTKASENVAQTSLLLLSLALAVISTGYIYASAEQAVRKTLTDDPRVTTTIAFAYQTSYFVPIACIIYSLFRGCFASRPAPAAALLVDDVEAGAGEAGAVEAGAVEAGAVEAGAVEAGAVEAAVDERPLACRAAEKGVAGAVALACGVGMLIIASEAAYATFRDRSSPSFLDPLYQPLYGTNRACTYLAHLPFFLLAVVPNIEGEYAVAACLKDLYDHPSAKKALLAAMVLGITAFTMLGTYMIASFGGVGMAPLVLALGTAALGNYTPSVKFAQMLLDFFISGANAVVCRGRAVQSHAVAALDAIVSDAPVVSFLAARRGDLPAQINDDNLRRPLAAGAGRA